MFRRSYTAHSGPRCFQSPPGPAHRYYDSIDCLPCAALLTPGTTLWLRSALLNPFTFRTPAPASSGSPLSDLCTYESVSVSFVAFSFISHIWVKSYGPCLFPSALLCLAWFSQDPSIHGVANGSISSILMAESCPVVYNMCRIFFTPEFITQVVSTSLPLWLTLRWTQRYMCLYE